MSLSLIIPVYNELNQIEFTIKKLLKFNKIFKNFETVFVDDFSSDGTEKIIKKYAKKIKFIKIFNNKKKGLGSAIEIGIIKSKKKYVCVFMSDMSDDLKDLKKYYKNN